LPSTLHLISYLAVNPPSHCHPFQWTIIKEEKGGVLNSVADDGADFTSAIEIATKMASRQFVFLTGTAAPSSLDDGNRCQAINEAAWSLALSTASPAARARFAAWPGRPLRPVADKTPTPNGGPWFIWNYLQFVDAGGDHVKVQSWSSFTPLDGLAYGAGTHYCKLLSPARALEWIYTDGLRKPAASTNFKAAADPELQPVKFI
jgi:hypothetical protein